MLFNYNILLEISIFLDRENLEFIKLINENIQDEYEKNIKRFIETTNKEGNFYHNDLTNFIRSDKLNHYEHIIQNVKDGKGIETHVELGRRYLIRILGYKNGEVNGKVIISFKEELDPNNQFKVLSESSYINNVKNGLEFIYNDNGSINKNFYVDGKYEGLQINYRENNSKIEIISEHYYKNDKYISSRRYINGKENYEETYYKEDGKSVRTFSNGILNGKAEDYIIPGVGYLLKCEAYYLDGVLSSITKDKPLKAFYRNGKKKIVAYYMDGKLNGVFTKYYNTEYIGDSIWIRAEYKDGVLNGEYYEFDKNGNIVLYQIYKDGILIE